MIVASDITLLDINIIMKIYFYYKLSVMLW